MFHYSRGPWQDYSFIILSTSWRIFGDALCMSWGEDNSNYMAMYKTEQLHNSLDVFREVSFEMKPPVSKCLAATPDISHARARPGIMTNETNFKTSRCGIGFFVKVCIADCGL